MIRDQKGTGSALVAIQTTPVAAMSAPAAMI
jgi:hypothetical protein